jgi:hypothetical protein
MHRAARIHLLALAVALSAAGLAAPAANAGSAEAAMWARLNVLTTNPAFVSHVNDLRSFASDPGVRAVVAPRLSTLMAGRSSGTPIIDVNRAADMYLATIDAALRNPKALPLSGDVTADAVIKNFNAIATSNRAAAVRSLLIDFFQAPEVHSYAASEIARHALGGRLFIEDLAFPDGLPGLPTDATPQGWGSIIGAVLGAGATIAGGVCIITVACPAIVGTVIIVAGAGAGIATILDQTMTDTASSAACTISTRIDYDKSTHDMYFATTAKCPENQAEFMLDLVLRNQQQTGISGTTTYCSNTKTCSNAMVTWMAPNQRTGCYYADGRYTVTNGTPASGQDTSGAYCLAGY